jgi:hypothetical protein
VFILIQFPRSAGRSGRLRDQHPCGAAATEGGQLRRVDTAAKKITGIKEQEKQEEQKELCTIIRPVCLFVLRGGRIPAAQVGYRLLMTGH